MYFEFAGKIAINNRCLVPEPLRRVVKFISKSYRDYNHYNDTIKSLRCGFEMYRSITDIEEAKTILPAYYASITKMTRRVTPGDIEIILGFLYYEANNPRQEKDLFDVNRHIYYERFEKGPDIV
jgi:hypothetical protein